MKKLVVALFLIMLGNPSVVSAETSLRGSKSAMANENRAADRLSLTRIRDDRHLSWFKDNKRLVPLPNTRCLRVDPRLKAKYRYVRPMTRTFLVQLSNGYCKQFPGAQLQVNSAVRTIEYQAQLKKHNKNAARGDTKLTRTSHTTGATVDITKLNLNKAQLRWMQKRLKLNEKVRRALVTEEHQQPVFHIMVLK